MWVNRKKHQNILFCLLTNRPSANRLILVKGETKRSQKENCHDDQRNQNSQEWHQNAARALGEKSRGIKSPHHHQPSANHLKRKTPMAKSYKYDPETDESVKWKDRQKARKIKEKMRESNDSENEWNQPEQGVVYLQHPVSNHLVKKRRRIT